MVPLSKYILFNCSCYRLNLVIFKVEFLRVLKTTDGVLNILLRVKIKTQLNSGYSKYKVGKVVKQVFGNRFH
jgi:hypothetical protein